MIFDFIKNHEKIFPIEKMCKVLQVSQSGYYRWKHNVISNRIQKMNILKDKITDIYFESKQRSGSPNSSPPIPPTYKSYFLLMKNLNNYWNQYGTRIEFKSKIFFYMQDNKLRIKDFN